MKLKILESLPIYFRVILLALSALFVSCEKFAYQVETVDPGVPVLFQTQIQPIFTNNCITCHKGSRYPDLRDGSSYESLTTGGYVNQPGETSRLYTKIVSGSHTAFTIDAEKQLILTWINQGAQNN